MRISDWSSDVCSSDLGWKDQTPEFAHIHPPKSKPALHEQRGFFDQLSAINHLLILEFSNGTPATTTVWRSSTRNPCLAKKPSAERLTWADSFRSEEHTSELQSLMRISYAVFCLKKKNNIENHLPHTQEHNNTIEQHQLPQN